MNTICNDCLYSGIKYEEYPCDECIDSEVHANFVEKGLEVVIMNKWQKVLDIINEVQGTDIKMGEVFEINANSVNPMLYLNMKITDFGLEDCYGHKHKNNALALLIYGDVKIKPKQWMPKEKEIYFTPNVFHEELYSEIEYCDDSYDRQAIIHNVCCKTKEEAIELAKKMLEVANDKL